MRCAGDWFCSGKCKEIHAALRARVAEGSFNIDADYQWQLLHGKDGSHATTWALKACYEILQESFDPIIDQVSGQDLVRGMVHSMQQGEWDHTGMFTAVLRHKVPAAPPTVCLQATVHILAPDSCTCALLAATCAPLAAKASLAAARLWQSELGLSTGDM